MLNKVYAFGSNGAGQLGIGNRDDVSRPTMCQFHPDLSDSASNITAGGNHTLVSCANLSLYASGENRDGRCGLGEATESSDVFRLVCFKGEDGDVVVRIDLCSATWESSCFVVRKDRDAPHGSRAEILRRSTEDLLVTPAAHCEVYTCGNGCKGELGQGDGITTSKNPHILAGFPPNGASVEAITSSMGHTVVVLSNGEAWGWGNGRKGQLGEPAALVWTPRKIVGVPFKVQNAVSGRDFTILLGSSSGSSFSFLGTNRVSICESLPNMLSSQQKMVASWSGAYTVTTDAKILSSGRNNYGQLSPPGLPAMTPLIAAGSEHVLARTATGHLLAWGWGEHGNCGVPDDNGVEGWNVIPFTGSLRGLAAGCATSFLMISTNEKEVSEIR